MLLKIDFQDKGHLDANLLFYILTIYRKCLLFQFLNYGIPMHIAILTEVQSEPISRQKSSHIFLKMFILELIFQDQGDLCVNCLFHILSLYFKCLLFQILILLAYPCTFQFMTGGLKGHIGS